MLVVLSTTSTLNIAVNVLRLGIPQHTSIATTVMFLLRFPTSTAVDTTILGMQLFLIIVASATRIGILLLKFTVARVSLFSRRPRSIAANARELSHLILGCPTVIHAAPNSRNMKKSIVMVARRFGLFPISTNIVILATRFGMQERKSIVASLVVLQLTIFTRRIVAVARRNMMSYLNNIARSPTVIRFHLVDTAIVANARFLGIPVVPRNTAQSVAQLLLLETSIVASVDHLGIVVRTQLVVVARFVDSLMVRFENFWRSIL